MSLHAIIQNSLRGAQYFVQRFQEDRCSEVAAALVYMSLFALVPLITVLFAVGSAIPTSGDLQQQLQQFLMANLVPAAAQDVAGYLTRFTEQAKNLTGFGVAILLVTAVLMLRNVERAFNTIWRTRQHRSPIASFLLYWAVLSLAPLLLGVGLGIQAYIFAAANAIAGIDTLGISTAVLSLLPFLITVFGFMVLYMAVPHCAVPPRHALIGAIATALAFSLAKATFTWVIAHSSYTLVYGAFAAVPVFLLWLYIIWTIVLLGAILVHSMSAYQTRQQAKRPRILKALDVLHVLWSAQREGRPIGELALLRDPRILGGLDSGSWRLIREQFIQGRLITEDHEGRYVLTRDLHAVSLAQLKTLIDEELPIPTPPPAGAHWQLKAAQLLTAQREAQETQLSLSLAALFADSVATGTH